MIVALVFVAQPALAKYSPSEYLPGPSVGDDEASLVKAAGDIGTTIFHPIGTAKMGLSSDPLAVVDREVDAVERDKATETLAQARDLQQWGAHDTLALTDLPPARAHAGSRAR